MLIKRWSKIKYYPENLKMTSLQNISQIKQILEVYSLTCPKLKNKRCAQMWYIIWSARMCDLATKQSCVIPTSQSSMTLQNHATLLTSACEPSAPTVHISGDSDRTWQEELRNCEFKFLFVKLGCISRLSLKAQLILKIIQSLTPVFFYQIIQFSWNNATA